MAGGRCEFCGVEEYMPFACKFCKGRYCAAHRLPENHNCQGLVAFKDRAASEGRVYVTPESPPPKPARAARATPTLSSFWSAVDGKMSYIILGICVGVYLLEFGVLATAGVGAFEDIFVIHWNFWLHPWTLLTSIFSHDPSSLNHLLFNMLALLFFGVSVERLLGTRRYTLLFLGAGIAAGVVQVELTHLMGVSEGALGASGALMGLMGTLAVLAPTLTVMVFFIVPAPLWALVIFYVLLDLVGFVSPGSNVAHAAHLAGLAVGLAYGYYLRQRGVRTVVRPPEQTRRMW